MTWLFVAIGGALGAMARFGVHTLISPEPGRFPSATFLANVIGCFLMGVIYVLIVEKQTLHPGLRPLLMVGFLGAFTTFSSFSLEALSLWYAKQYVTAGVYVGGSLFACIVAVWAGFALGERFIH